MSYRSLYRTIALTALAAHPRTSGMTQIMAWAGNIDAATLPVLGVVTPQEKSVPSAHGQFERVTSLQVVIKRLGGSDLETILDADAAAIEPLIMTAVGSREVQCLLDDLTITVNDDGAHTIGTLIATFRVTSWRALGT